MNNDYLPLSSLLPRRASGVPLGLIGQAYTMGLLEPGNIDLGKRPVVRNPDGTISTVRSMSVGFDGKHYLIPTVAADGRGILSDQDAIEQFRQSGQHLGVFNSPDAATAYSQRLHNMQADEYGQ